jgi:hypothetical protein
MISPTLISFNISFSKYLLPQSSNARIIFCLSPSSDQVAIIELGYMNSKGLSFPQ